MKLLKGYIVVSFGVAVLLVLGRYAIPASALLAAGLLLINAVICFVIALVNKNPSYYIYTTFMAASAATAVLFYVLRQPAWTIFVPLITFGAAWVFLRWGKRLVEKDD